MPKQETTKGGMAGMQSGNEIWEDWLKTSLNAMVNLTLLYDLEIWMDKVKVTKVATIREDPLRTN